MNTRNGRAFALMDLAATLAAALILTAMLAFGLAETRRSSGLDESISNLKRFGDATRSFTADHEDRLWGYTWQAGDTVTWLNAAGDLEQIVIPDDELAGSSYQAVHLMRTLDDRVGERAISEVPSNWVAPVFYSHLPLMEYLGEDPLSRMTVDPGDRVRLAWKDDPVNKFDQGLWLPLQPDPTEINKRWPYSSSYRTTLASWDANGSNLREDAPRVSHGSVHNNYTVPNAAIILAQSIADVHYTANKTHVQSSHQWHFGSSTPYYAADYGESRQPLLFFDGAVSVRRTADANPGWSPHYIQFICASFWYQPDAWEPATTNGEFQQFCKGFYYWTRGGLKGVDFGGLPLDTGQATPGECDL